MPRPTVGGLRETLVGASWRGALLIVGGLLVAFAHNAVRPDGIAWRSYEPPTSCDSEAARPEVGAVTPQELSTDCVKRSVIIADARPAARFELGHITGAVHLPCTASADAARVVDSLLEGRQDLVVYGDSELESRPVAETLASRAGPNVRVRVLAGGFQAWADQGLACSSGECECDDDGHRVPKDAQ